MNNTEQNQINTLLLQTDEYVRYEYLSVLDQSTPRELSKKYSEIVPGTNMQLMHLESFVFNSNDNIAQKIWSIYGSIEGSGTTAALILDGRKDRIDLYLGVFTEDSAQTSSGYKAFINSFNGVFPGCKFRNVKMGDGMALLDELLNPQVDVAVAAVSGFPVHARDSRSCELSGMEMLIDGMRGRPFTMILLAETMDRAELVQMRQGYESLYTQISPLHKQDISVSSSRNDTFGTSFSRSIADSLSISSGISRGHTETHGFSHSTQTGPSLDDQKKHQSANQLLGTAVTAVSLLTLGPEGLAVKKGVNLLQNLFYGQTVANLLNSVGVVTGLNPESDNKTETDSEHEDYSDSETTQESTTEGRTETDSESASKSIGLTRGQTSQFSYVNKPVAGLLDRIDKQIQEIVKLESEGAYKFAAYFIAGDEETAVAAASLYRSIATAGSDTVTNSPVYHWKDKKKTESILSAIQRGIHPWFEFEGYTQFPYITTAQPIGLSDIPYYLCLPQKSLFGLQVDKHAGFARDVIERNDRGDGAAGTVSIGCIYHMGKEVKSTPVKLDVNTLTSHLFVAGATGVGKSNFCYQLLERLTELDVKVLVIEPAKGEYAKVFGGRKDLDFTVYGTNLRQAPPLRINPFAFPKGVTASEHIERLLAIFSSAWPMYSAMPAIMKDALEEIYRMHGFDDVWGELPEEGTFPTFEDLLMVLPAIIKDSEYSAEVKGNYTGALVTRVKSLTNGLYNIIFSEDEIGDCRLFDENVIIDLSRIGSEETKSLIIGFLVTRLVEYRSCSGRMNSELKHITLLEEAHHLLGKQAGNQSQDVGNMRGASVEMLSNAIREMRTYGEGFIIADQSPTVMEPTVISNTQTKVFFMMPRREDRSVAGDAASLDEDQTAEIARLPRGVAVVWQNEWSAAVLCKVNYFPPDKQQPFQYDVDSRIETKKLMEWAITILISNRLGGKAVTNPSATDMEKELEICDNTGIGLGKKRKPVLRLLRDYQDAGKMPKYSLETVGDYLQKLLDMDEIFRRNRTCTDISAWTQNMRKDIYCKVQATDDEIHGIISSCLLIRSKREPHYQNLYVEYLSYHDSERV